MKIACSALLFALSACAAAQVQPNTWTRSCPDQKAPKPAGAIQSSDFIELQRTVCFGTCPVYTLRVYADGRLNWHGEKFVNVVGDVPGRVDPEQARSLIERARTLHFWKLCGQYAATVTDLPTILTTVRLAGQTKQVSDYAAVAPAWLRDLDAQIDALADNYDWKAAAPKARKDAP